MTGVRLGGEKWARRPPLTVAVATLVAYGALHRSTGGAPALYVVTVAFLGIYLSDWRVQRRSWQPWLFRVLLACLIGMSGNEARSRGADTFLTYRTVEWLGQIAAGETVIQAWSARPMLGVPGLGLVFWSGMTLLAGSNTYDPVYLKWAAPAFVGLSVLALLEFRRGGAATVSVTAHALRLLSLATALVVGTAIHTFLWSSRGSLNRWANDLILGRQYSRGGFSGAPSLGATWGFAGDFSRMMRVEGPLPESHLRGLSFDTYSRGRWGPTVNQRKLTVASDQDLGAGAKGKRTRVIRNRPGSILFTPLYLSGLDPLQIGTVRWDRANGGPFRAELSGALEYDLILPPEGSTYGHFATPLTAEQRQSCLAVPAEIDPAVRRLAARIGEGARSDRRKIHAVVGYLNANHHYSLVTDPGEGDPVSGFLLRKKAAHCEYFASAAVILLRCLGVPTRYVTGFYAHEKESAEATIVRQRDAHAWAESWVPGTGWMVVEATPASGRPDEMANEVPTYLRWWEWLQDRPQVLRRWISELRGVRLAAVVLACCLVLAWALGWRGFRWRRRSGAGAIAYTEADPELTRMARRFERYLRRTGPECPPGATWEDHLRAAANGATEGAPVAIDIPAAGRFVREYNAARFGGRDDPGGRSRLASLLADLEGKRR